MVWIISQALMNSLCSQEQEVESLEANFLDGEQSVQSNGSRTQQAYCAPDKMTVCSRLSRFGMTYKPLMETRGEELLTLYREDFRVKTLAPQEKAQELTENEAECGEKWRASFTKWSPDLSLWKTHQCSLLGDLDEFSETWPQWGLMRNGECWEQRTLEQSIRGTESGLLVNISPPPTWPTPTAHMSKETNAPSEHNRNTPTLTAQANWPTPRTKGMCGGSGAWEQLKANTTIEEARAMGAGNGGKLNPEWVEWLMGWPLGWTDLKSLEMDKSHFVQQQHGESLEANNG
jgi:hypothetical protein